MALARTIAMAAAGCARARGASLRRFGTETTVGFIGLGNMGGHMARNLQAAGHKMVVFDLSDAATASLKAGGALVAKTPAEVAAKASVIVTMLPSSPHVQKVYLGENGIAAGASGTGAKFCIDASTIAPPVAKQVSDAMGAHGHVLIDAPVSGGTAGAEKATLTFMVGASESAFEKAKPLLARMGKNIVRCGDVSTGQVAKVCNNMVLGISMIAVSEALNLGVKLGADPKTLSAIMNTSSGRCWSSDTYNPCPGVMPGVPASRGFTGGFGSKLMMKDLSLAVEAAKDAGVPLNLGANAHALYQLMVNAGLGDKDFSGYWQFLQGAEQGKKQ
eukprot:a843652_91.p1 GENE.a843652_91~~a843652_91.p1  ORF type:complete len:344 (-),score=112.47 a843652_91:21-1013(-)